MRTSPCSALRTRQGCSSCTHCIHLPHSLKAAWFQPLNLSSEKLVSIQFAVEFNLYRYNSDSDADSDDADSGERRVRLPGDLPYDHGLEFMGSAVL
jgi:hypothetical protein